MLSGDPGGRLRLGPELPLGPRHHRAPVRRGRSTVARRAWRRTGRRAGARAVRRRGDAGVGPTVQGRPRVPAVPSPRSRSGATTNSPTRSGRWSSTTPGPRTERQPAARRRNLPRLRCRPGPAARPRVDEPPTPAADRRPDRCRGGAAASAPWPTWAASGRPRTTMPPPRPRPRQPASAPTGRHSAAGSDHHRRPATRPPRPGQRPKRQGPDHADHPADPDRGPHLDRDHGHLPVAPPPTCVTVAGHRLVLGAGHPVPPGPPSGPGPCQAGGGQIITATGTVTVRAGHPRRDLTLDKVPVVLPPPVHVPVRGHLPADRGGHRRRVSTAPATGRRPTPAERYDAARRRSP